MLEIKTETAAFIPGLFVHDSLVNVIPKKYLYLYIYTTVNSTGLQPSLSQSNIERLGVISLSCREVFKYASCCEMA